jgi:type VI secretion system FHA domain protein
VTLTLEITAASQTRPGENPRHVFGENGGSIGRAGTNSWVLSHSEVSGHHAQITFRNGVFYIQDKSRNGVAVNSPDNRLVRDRPYALKAGDRLFIEPYQIDVWIDSASERPAHPAPLDPFGVDDPFALPHDPSLARNLAPTPGAPVSDEVDPLKFFDPVSGPPKRKPDPVSRPVDDLLNSHYEPPAVLPNRVPPVAVDPVAIPQDYDPLREEEPSIRLPAEPPPPPAAPPLRPRPGEASEARRRVRETPSADSTVRQPFPSDVRPAPPEVARAAATPRAPEPARAPGASADLSELLAGAGVPEAAITPELSRNLGEILGIVVAGLMDILQSRQRIKEEFRMQQTLFRPAENNPLKFSANVEDALHNLLVKRNPAYLGAVDAFADAFDDLRDHQLAMLEGMRVAFESMLAEFDPDKLQQEFDAQIGKLALPLVPAKMRYWELYRERRQEMGKDPEATFASLFGEEFRRAYEEQFRKLKAARRARGRQSSKGPSATP